jgi:hypothetical protein
MQIVSRVFVLNLLLVALAATAIAGNSAFVQFACLVAGLAAVAFVLRRFAARPYA